MFSQQNDMLSQQRAGAGGSIIRLPYAQINCLSDIRLLPRVLVKLCIPQRCGVEVLVLEARSRVGGRVQTQQSGGLTAPVDLGASIITGTEVDIEKGLQPDPSTIIAR